MAENSIIVKWSASKSWRMTVDHRGGGGKNMKSLSVWYASNMREWMPLFKFLERVHNSNV